MEVLVLRLEAPLMSFGAPMVDQNNVIQAYPALSLITGLLGNALGFDHSDHEKLNELQSRLRYAVREDRTGQKVQDYQTVDLSKDHMDEERAWTTQGWLDKRKGASSKGTHIRFRDYWADAVHTVVLTLDPEKGSPNIDELEEALKHPERPLFIGRKSCLPTSPLLIERTKAPSLIQALKAAPLSEKADGSRSSYKAWWPYGEDAEKTEGEMERPVVDQRDWNNQIHTGERWIVTGSIEASQ